MFKFPIVIGVLAALVAIFIAGGNLYFFGERPFEIKLEPANTAMVKKGAVIYAEYCASCHGADLEGQPNWQSPDADGKMPAPPHDQRGHTWHHSDEVLFGVTKLGTAAYLKLEGFESAMPMFEAVLKDEEIIAVLSYIKAQWPAEIRERHNQMNAAGKG
ncbi:MAG: cytochrome C [Hyphomicrobiales bacterium]|nr:MAG: cytochrome C [Hyphomicrobiales bacterium]